MCLLEARAGSDEMTELIPFLRPTFPSTERLGRVFKELATSGIYSNGGPGAAEFERALAGRIGSGSVRSIHVSLVRSGTIGLQLAIQALVDRRRPEVLVTSFTFAAGPLMIRQAGFRCRFIDINPETWQPNIEQASRYLHHHRDRVAGILLTNTFGTANNDIAAWEEMSTAFEVPLVIDSAAGMGSTYSNGEPLGQRGTCEVFSFHATKTLAIGEGGAVATSSQKLWGKLERMKNFGFDGDRRSVIWGTNGRLDELSSKIGSLQLEDLDRRLWLRRRIFDWYSCRLASHGVRFQPLARESALPFVPAKFAAARHREAALSAMKKAGVGVRCYYNPPVHRHPVFASTPVLELNATADLSRRVISLPMSDSLSETEITGICDAITASIRRTHPLEDS